MTPAEKEAEKVNQAYHDALVVIGDQLVKAVLAAFDAVNIRSSASFSQFSAKVAALIYLYRRKARDLSVAETQLTRALLTGTTYADWQAPFTGPVTLGVLRNNFNEKVQEFGVAKPLRARTLEPAVAVSVDVIPEIEEAERRQAQEIDEEVETTLRVLGEEAVEKKLKLVKDDMSVEQANQIETKIREVTSSRLAMGAERIALNGGRHNDSNVIELDPKMVGWARVHSVSAPDNPCGYCSMLMSRGAAYRTEAAALAASHGLGEFHGSCHCIAVKVYTKSQYDSPRFDKNREYTKLWPEVTGKYSGKDKLVAWRKFIREREANKPVRQAPAAKTA